jgi:hypothetical protein
MIRIGTIVWFIVLAMLGIGLFQVKYAVQSKERELRTVNRQITADREAMRVLDAEWSYLNDPMRLADLTRRHTDLAPVMAGQIATFENLAPRPIDMEETAPAMPPIAALPDQKAPAGDEAPAIAMPASVRMQNPPDDAPQNAPAFQTSAASKQTPTADAPADDDATIRAILADMQSNQGGDAQPSSIRKSAPANEAGVE